LPYSLGRGVFERSESLLKVDLSVRFDADEFAKSRYTLAMP
jgi:hypothetical protein